ncbi:hypothetical protein JCM11641_001163 [Rhodosporidiobolus odoratus]
MTDSNAAAVAHHEANKATLVSAASSITPPPPALNPLLARGKLKKASSSNKSKTKSKTDKIKSVYQAKQDELQVVSAGGPDPVEEGQVLDLADQLLEQLGGQLEDDQAAEAAEATSSPTPSSSRGAPLSPTSTQSSEKGTMDKLHDFKEDLKDTFLPNRNSDGGEKKVNRQQARKLRKADAVEQQRKEAEAEVAAENDRSVEMEKQAIDAQCKKFKVHIKECPPDGHCMFSAIADQANFLQLSTTAETYQSTRAHAASYMRSHPGDFLPFLPSNIDPDNVMSQAEFARYCDVVEKTAEWGGEPEIRALSLYYQAPITVVQAGTEAVEHGGDLPKEKTMLISYHRKMYGLGEAERFPIEYVGNALTPTHVLQHYNSLRPAAHGAPHSLPAEPAVATEVPVAAA